MDALKTAGLALRAAGLRDTPIGRLQFIWTRCREAETDWVLGLQASRITPTWARQQIELCGLFPPPGAVLICPHHWNQRLGFLMLANQRRLALVANDAPATDTAAAVVPGRATWRKTRQQELRPLFERTFEGRRFSGFTAARAALEHVLAGGSVILAPDRYRVGTQRGSILGR